MSEARDGQHPGGGYPSAGFSEAPAAPADPFGPQSVPDAEFDPFSASPPTTASSAVPSEAAREDAAAEARRSDDAGLDPSGPVTFFDMHGIPVIDRSQIADRHLAEALGLEDGTASSPGGGAAERGEDEVSATRIPPTGVLSPTQDLSGPEQRAPRSLDGVEPGPATSAPSTSLPAASASPVAPSSYPSAEALPLRKGEQGRSFAHGLRRMIRSESLPTAPMRVVDRLVDSPFANPRRNKETSEARRTLNFAARLAETMFHYGADAMDVESAIVAICATYGVEDVDVDITNQSITINYVSNSGIYVDAEQSGSDAEIFSHTVVRVVRSWSDNYSGLTATHRLVKTIIDGDLPRAEAERRLTRITSEPKPFPRWMTVWANILAAGAFTIGIGGEWFGALLACLTFAVVTPVSAKFAKWRVPSFFIMAAGSATVTAVAMTAYILGLPISPAHIIGSGLIMLLPTFRLVSTIQDAINGFPVTAAGRMVSTALSFVGLIAGLAIAISLTTTFFAFPDVNMLEVVFASAEWYLHVVFMLLATALVAVSVQVDPRHILPGVLSAAVGLVFYYAATALGVGPRMVSLTAAVSVGCASAWLAQRYSIPQVVLAVPGLMFLLPGLSIFRGMYMFTVDSNPVEGLVPLINASAVILSMAAAVVLGNYLMRPFMKQRQPRRLKAPRRR
ncbi:threonine/serine exporter family protein [Rothia halotolerans]|uniref:threonine/serine exporter family protein n=1 Tax=Rothia halotolerans TaxID=405770 RepID=UPI00101B8D37|nr:threonine/serine exporter family protein [Rothia halotolerans]